MENLVEVRSNRILKGLGMPIFLIWAHKKPKVVFKSYCDFANEKFRKKLIIVIDDITPRLLENISKERQNEVNTEYRNFFSNEQCVLYFLSENFDMNMYIWTASKIRLAEFVHFLPTFKKNLDSYDTLEFIHFINNIYAYFVCTEYSNNFLLGSNVIGRFMAFKEIYEKEHKKKLYFTILNYTGQAKSVF